MRIEKEHQLRPKVGHIQFLNCIPLYYGLVKSHAMLDIELIKGTPTELNRMLISGKLDVSPVSSIEYARHSDSLTLFPDFTVSSDGEVKSILLLSRLPVEKLSGRVVALATTSATSQVLLKLILSHRYAIEPEYVSCEPEPDKMFAIADAGAIVEFTTDDSHRLVSALPLVHISVIRATDIVATLKEAAAPIRNFYQENPLNANVSFISGPSRTADIEMRLIHGVHGPAETHTIILT